MPALAIALGLLAAAAGPQSPGGAPTADPPPAAAAPAAAAIPEVKIEAPEPRYVAPTKRDRIGRIWAPVLINGQGPFRLVLDTGASHSALIATTAARLGLMPGDARPTQLYGITGTALVPSVHVDSMEVGEILMAPSDLPIVADVFGGAEGVLGREALPDKRILADFQHDRLVIAMSHRQPAPPGYMTIKLQLTEIGLLAIDTRVGGVAAKAIVDTGAETTIGNVALRNALMRRRPLDAHTAEIVGVTLDVQTGDNLPSPPLQLGPMRLNGLHVTFGDMSLFEHWQLTHEPVLLIGMDVLGLMDVLIIDYRMRELQVRLRAGAPGAIINDRPPGSGRTNSLP
jgi:predicted aspartyl protease